MELGLICDAASGALAGDLAALSLVCAVVEGVTVPSLSIECTGI